MCHSYDPWRLNVKQIRNTRTHILNLWNASSDNQIYYKNQQLGNWPLKAVNWENIAAVTWCVNVAHNISWVSKQEGSRTLYVASETQNSASSTYVVWVHKPGNIWETVEVSASPVFPVCTPTQQMLKTQNKQNLVLTFSKNNFCFPKGRHKRWKSKKCFWKISETFFCFHDADFVCLQPVLLGDANEETFWKHWRNADFESFPNVSSFAYPSAYAKDAKFASGKQKCFAFFLFAHPSNNVNSIDRKCFSSNVFSFAWFCFCNNDSSFTPASINCRLILFEKVPPNLPSVLFSHVL